jgi:hypothetical protein
MEAAQVFLRLDCDHHTPFILMLSGETNVPYASPIDGDMHFRKQP